MAKNKKQEETQGDYLENPEALAEQISRTEEFVEKNKVLVFGVIIGVVLIVGGFFGYNYYKNQQEQIAQSEMFQAIYYFEADSLDKALQGDGSNPGFITIAKEYNITDAGNLANYYAGLAYLKQGKYKPAILYLEDFSADDLLVQARAYSLIGDAHMELAQYDQAAEYYQKAAGYKPNEYFTPTYLMKAALAYEKANKPEQAKEAYQKIIEEYWQSNEYQKAKKMKARMGE
ncbi:MAG: tetratricopeptide repeat protein [Fulvivirga sp.]|nr:tetratricopeptide repeat protein [Fulvivirga sp.]